MTMVPCSRWPLAEHIAFGQNTFDVSIGSVVSFCIGTSCRWIPIFSSPPHFHRLVGLYPSSDLGNMYRRYDFPACQVGHDLTWSPCVALAGHAALCCQRCRSAEVLIGVCELL